MKPFKVFFGLSIAFMLFFFVARIAIVAFIAAGIMSIVYAIFRRLKDFVTYDRFGEPYMKARHFRPAVSSNWENQVEPLFISHNEEYDHKPNSNVRYIQTI